jgi:hypothetical protein
MDPEGRHDKVWEVPGITGKPHKNPMGSLDDKLSEFFCHCKNDWPKSCEK